MWRRLLWAAAGVFTLLVFLLAGIVIAIRSGLQRYSDEAIVRFPGTRVEALIRVVDCGTCAIEDRNHAIWALGQMAEERAGPVLKKYFDGRRCTHQTRLCQYELRKAIRMIETRNRRTGPVMRILARWHQPWR
jgi:hypothetical protein